LEKVKLKCIKEDEHNDFKLNEVYDFYLVQYENEDLYEIEYNGAEYTYTIVPDQEGLSYKNWFELVE